MSADTGDKPAKGKRRGGWSDTCPDFADTVPVEYAGVGYDKAETHDQQRFDAAGWSLIATALIDCLLSRPALHAACLIGGIAAVVAWWPLA